MTACVLNPEGPILVPVDFSKHSEAALIFAMNIAELMERQVIVLHIVHEPASAPGYYRRESSDDSRTFDAIAAEMMEKFIEEAKKTCPNIDFTKAETKFLDGIPSRRIVEYAKKIDAHMVVMGSHGHRGLKSVLIASKARKVMQYAPMPVTVVKADEMVQKLMKKEAK